MSRRQRSRPQDGDNPTSARILEQAMIVVTEDGFDQFNVQRVLDGAGVSRTTLYNHFTDVDTLIERALVATFAQETDHYVALLGTIVADAPDRAAFGDAVRSLITAFSHLPAAVRLRRTHTIALGAARPTLQASIAEQQDRITAAWATTISDAQQRGFIRRDLEPHATAVMVLSITIGRIVDDAAGEQISDQQWASAFIDIAERAILTPED
jgi:AcrR family transcriptional regulator